MRLGAALAIQIGRSVTELFDYVWSGRGGQRRAESSRRLGAGLKRPEL
jgi:hypothetical protein